MFYSAIIDRRTLNGYYQGGMFFGPRFLKQRHKEIKKFIAGHKSKMVIEPVFSKLASRINDRLVYFYPDRLPTTQEMWLSWHTLMTRCRRCRKKHLRAKREGYPTRYELDPGIVDRITRHGTPSERGYEHP